MATHCIDVIAGAGRWRIAAALIAWLASGTIAVAELNFAQSQLDTSPVEEQNGDGPDTEPLPQIYYSGEALPDAVLKTRNALLLAARSGDLEQLRPILDAAPNKPIVSFGGDEDAIAYWKGASIDGTGRDILAEMIKVFSSGFVHINKGTPEALYIWPYHFVYPLDKLNAEQEVELYLLIPAQHREDMEAAGGYIGFRAGIDTNGSLLFFVAGD